MADTCSGIAVGERRSFLQAERGLSERLGTFAIA
jgi:hypothetical protein